MIDANLKLGPGFMDGNFNLMGNFKECRNVKATYKEYTNLPGTHDFDAKYCRIYYPLIEDYVSVTWGWERHMVCYLVTIIIFNPPPDTRYR